MGGDLMTAADSLRVHAPEIPSNEMTCTSHTWLAGCRLVHCAVAVSLTGVRQRTRESIGGAGVALDSARLARYEARVGAHGAVDVDEVGRVELRLTREVAVWGRVAIFRFMIRVSEGSEYRRVGMWSGRWLNLRSN